MGIYAIAFFRLDTLKGFWMMVVYPLIYEHIFVHVWILILIFIANFNSKCPLSIIGTLFWNRRIFSSSLDLFLAVFLFYHSLDCLVDWTCHPYKVYCMHPFLRPLFLDECTGRCLFLPVVLNVIAIGFMTICLFLV